MNHTNKPREWTHTNITNMTPFCFQDVSYFVIVYFVLSFSLSHFVCPGKAKVCWCEVSSQKQDHLGTMVEGSTPTLQAVELDVVVPIAELLRQESYF